MRKFIKSLWGKIVLFTVINLSLIILAASAVGIYLMTDVGLYNFYVHNENEINRLVLSDALRSDAYTVLLDELKENIISPGREYCEYLIRDENGNELARTDNYDPDAAYCHTLKYGVLKDESGTVTDVFYSVLYNDDYNIGEVIYPEDKAVYYSVSIYPHKGTPLYREMETLDILVDIGYSLRYAIFFIALASVILIAVSFVGLMYASGRRSGSDGIFPGPLFKVPFDLLLAFCLFAAIFAVLIIDSLGSMLNDVLIIALICFFCLIGVNILLGLCMSAATRIKLHTFIKNTVIFKVLKLIWFILRTIWKGVKAVARFFVSLLRGIPLIWKTAVAVVLISLCEIIFIAETYCNFEDLIAFWVIEKIIVIPMILYIALALRRLQRSGEALAKGDLRHHTDTKGMIWDLKKHGENLNSISDGISIAVEERLKSERMKTELITNVSHDIKTPLTSIINYASLIGSENCGDPKINEYSEVLVRQSEKLKRLLEDLVEASKASTGNLDVLLSPCDASTFITQTCGEYEERMKTAELALVTKLPEKELVIMADGRRMWRIFDNLMNNICKYSLPGTRVYLSLEERDGRAVFDFKNTSREPLDMTEDELTERFTRGDSSRNTEGNGLGLSIAKSMAELQGGSLRLSTDGDLFKATLSFPTVR